MEIPAGVRNLLWEYSIDDFSIDESWERTVLGRVMQLGGWDEMRWLLRNFDRPRLRSFLEGRGRRALAPRELRFWALICGVPADIQDDWVQQARRSQQSWRG